MGKPPANASKIQKFIWDYPWAVVLMGVVTGWSILGLILIPAGLKVMYDKYRYNKQQNDK